MNVRVLAYICLSITAVFWGATFPIVKPALDYISPFQYLLLRYSLIAVFLFPVFIYQIKKNKIGKKVFLGLILLMCMNGLSLAGNYYGLTLTTAIESSMISSTMPLFVTFGGVIFLSAQETISEWIGTGIAFLGTVILGVGPVLFGGSADVELFSTGNILIMISTVMSALYYITLKIYFSKTPSLIITCLNAFFVIPVFLLMTSLVDMPLTITDIANRDVITALVFSAIGASIIGFTLYVYAQQFVKASEAAVFTYLSGIVAIPFSIFLLGEDLHIHQVIAVVFIICGVLFTRFGQRVIGAFVRR